jgi:hypothetical protein
VGTDLYIIDANVMIEAANVYSFEVVPGFWAWLTEQCERRTIRSASLVKDEVDFPPELVEWIKLRDDEGFLIDVSVDDVQAKLREISDWVIAQDFGPEHVAKFLDGADPWIIAVASVRGAVVVTQEKSVGPTSKKIKIPNVCQSFDVRCINTFELLRDLGAVFG